MAKSGNFLCLALLTRHEEPVALWGIDLSGHTALMIPWINLSDSSRTVIIQLFELEHFDVTSTDLRSYAIQLSQNTYFVVSSDLRILKMSANDLNALRHGMYNVVPIKKLLLSIKQFNDLSLEHQMAVFEADSSLGKSDGVSYDSRYYNNAMPQMNIDLSRFTLDSIVVPFGIFSVNIYSYNGSDKHLKNLIITDTVSSIEGIDRVENLSVKQIYFRNKGFSATARGFKDIHLKTMDLSGCDIAIMSIDIFKDNKIKILSHPKNGITTNGGYTGRDDFSVVPKSPVNSIYSKPSAIF